MTDENTTPDGSAQPPSGDGSAGPSAVSGPTDAAASVGGSASREDDAFYDLDPEVDDAATARPWWRRSLPVLVGVGAAAVVLLVALGLRVVLGGGDEPSADQPGGFVVPAAVPDAPGHKPLQLNVPSIGLTAKIIPIAKDADGVLTPPESPMVGWWNYSARAGASRGQMLVTGHTIHTGGGIMNKLGEVKKGSIVKIKSTKGTYTYRTTKVVVLSKAELAKNAKTLFGQDRGDGNLVLVTCDDWVNGEYLSNIVLSAEPIRKDAGSQDTTSVLAR